MRIPMFAGCALLASAMAAAPASAQDDDRPRSRSIALSFGLGHEFGGAGIGLELGAANERYSLLGGVGQLSQEVPGTDKYVGQTAFAVGARRYLDGGKHRWFGQLLVGPVEWYGRYSGTLQDPRFEADETYYGGSAGAGYKFTAYNGFTFQASLGLLWSSRDDDANPVLALGLGYSL